KAQKVKKEGIVRVLRQLSTRQGTYADVLTERSVVALMIQREVFDRTECRVAAEGATQKKIFFTLAFVERSAGKGKKIRRPLPRYSVTCFDQRSKVRPAD